MDDTSVISIHVLGVHMNSIDECLEVFRVHVRVHAMSQIGDVSLSAKLLQHVLDVTSNVILDSDNREVFLHPLYAMTY